MLLDYFTSREAAFSEIPRLKISPVDPTTFGIEMIQFPSFL
jgi:hypothetical protein